MTDGQLLSHFVADRNEAAFEALVRRHGPMVLGVCRRVLRHEYPRKNLTVPFQTASTHSVKQGVSVFPQLQDSFFTPFTDDSPGRLVDVPLNAVLTGKTNRPTMSVRLPRA